MPGLSIRAYAAHRKKLGLRGGTPTAVQKALQTGRITKTDGKIDPLTADPQWEATTPPTDIPSLAKAKLAKEVLQAKLLELDYEQKKGRLVEMSLVSKEFFERARATRERLMAIPSRLGPELLSMKNQKEVEKMLTDALTEALQELAGEPRIGGGR